MATVPAAPRGLAAIFQGIDRRSRLFGTMIQVTGADLGRLTHACGESALRGAVMRCQTCRVADPCEAWLGEAAAGAEPPEFCPNAGLFRTLRPLPEAEAGPLFEPLWRAIAGTLGALRTGYDAYRELIRLTDMSDDELAGLGLRREDVPRAAFRRSRR